MAQTALQRAIEQLQSKIAISKQDMEYYRQTIQMDSVCTEHDIQTGLLQSIQILTSLLPYERETIEGAHKDWQFTNAENYFTKTYNQ